MFLIRVCDVPHSQIAVEFLFLWVMNFNESFPAIHVLVSRIDKHFSAVCDKTCYCIHHRTDLCFQNSLKNFHQIFLISFVALHTLHIWVSCIHILTYKLCIYLFADFADLFIFFVRLDRKLVLNLTLSIDLVLYFIVLRFFYCFIGTKKIMYFSPFSLRHSNCPLNFCVIRFIKK